MSPAAVSRWETGESLPRPSTIPKLARALGMDPMALMRVMSPGEPVDAGGAK